MIRVEKFEIPLSGEDTIDVKIMKEKGKITGFSLNLRCKIDDVWYAVYRADTAHGYLHEQRFWINPEPIKLPMLEGMSNKYLFNFFMNNIRKSFKRFRKYFEEKMKFKG